MFQRESDWIVGREPGGASLCFGKYCLLTQCARFQRTGIAKQALRRIFSPPEDAEKELGTSFSNYELVPSTTTNLRKDISDATASLFWARLSPLIY
jgi:hypothetical protein